MTPHRCIIVNRCMKDLRELLLAGPRASCQGEFRQESHGLVDFVPDLECHEQDTFAIMTTLSSSHDLRIKAGTRAYAMIQDGGFSFDRITTYFGPATGPRWIIAGGFDLSLMKSGLLGRKWPLLLVGASAGAWRLAAWMQPEAEKCYRTLMEAYITAIYSKMDTPETIKTSLEAIVNTAIESDALPFALANRKYRLAIITARSKHLVASKTQWIQGLGLGLCFLMNAAHRSLLYRFAESVVFYSGPKPPPFTLKTGFKGHYVPLSEVNFKPALIASGAIPLVVAGVSDIYGAPNGIYRDGGLTDYHLTRTYASNENDLTLFFLHQERIIPGWLDKRLKNRQPPPEALENVVMVFPSDNLIAKLPQGKVPDRDDFKTYMDNPALRIKNWRQAAALSSHLGEVFLEMVESNKIRDVVERL
jgi:hypothetical protein